jgi:uncharacterized protein YjbJ (UPF0337 family)
MNRDTLQDRLKQLRAAVKQRWGVLTDKDLDTVDVKLAKLPGLLQEKYGYTGEQANKEIKLFCSDLQAKGQNIVELVEETLTNETPEQEAHVK